MMETEFDRVDFFQGDGPGLDGYALFGGTAEFSWTIAVERSNRRQPGPAVRRNLEQHQG